ncbi:hypothetical protein OPV22_021099 [Ensete ventricosum]|uniref:Uncharacterized protein n=1 Tax=Ensete ventricosum TaxID=4639 RepID=A0AAV8QGD2_ENSVE|nr:hypothetical protein OPV22_021099 [Ensete ventricosum]RWV87230.1 hypothetical protein GW17_00050799 [Ensete ventricosum]RWW48963.1 hypothetical protein BHE74_00044919 [Ensete ventricosum]RZR85227.1 hypothetical protein BHM03_00012181 [Ensete ventricosum]
MEAKKIRLEPIVDESFAPRRRRYFDCLWTAWSAPGSSSSSAESWKQIHGVGGQREGRWLSRVFGAALTKVREWSELVARPRWNAFIRHFGRNRHGGGWRAASARFQYDPLSYALNFDEGHGECPEEEYMGYRDFSTRYAAPPASA